MEHCRPQKSSAAKVDAAEACANVMSPLHYRNKSFSGLRWHVVQHPSTEITPSTDAKAPSVDGVVPLSDANAMHVSPHVDLMLRRVNAAVDANATTNSVCLIAPPSSSCASTTTGGGSDTEPSLEPSVHHEACRVVGGHYHHGYLGVGSPPKWQNASDLKCSLYEGWGGHELTRAMGAGTLMEDVGARLTECAPTEENANRAKRCLREVGSALLQLGPSWHVLPLGSQATGFALRDSDLDATCLSGDSSNDTGFGGRMVIPVLRRLGTLLEQNQSFEVTEKIFAARVPILRLRFEQRLVVDLSCRNSQALLNTRLLRTYANIHDTSVRDLGKAVKIWIKAARVSGAALGYLSTYAFMLMAIYFMQVDPFIRLPCVRVCAFDGGSAPKAGRVNELTLGMWRCQLPLPMLIARFFRFFAEQFMWGHEVVSVRLGRRANADGPEFASLAHRGHPHIHVEDPFLLDRNLSDVLGKRQELHLRAAFADALLIVLSGRTPVGLRPSLGHSCQQRRLLKVPRGRALEAEMLCKQRFSTPVAEAKSPVLEIDILSDSAEPAQQTDLYSGCHQDGGLLETTRGLSGLCSFCKARRPDVASRRRCQLKPCQAGESDGTCSGYGSTLPHEGNIAAVEEDAEVWDIWLHACCSYTIFVVCVGGALRVLFAVVLLIALVCYVRSHSSAQFDLMGQGRVVQDRSHGHMAHLLSCFQWAQQLSLGACTYTKLVLPPALATIFSKWQKYAAGMPAPQIRPFLAPAFLCCLVTFPLGLSRL